MATPAYSGNGAIVTYTLASNVYSNNAGSVYSVNSITVTNSGANYNYPPQIRLEGGGGFGATAVAGIDSNGQISNITVTNQGTGYSSAPNVVFYDKRTESLGTIQVVVPGAGYGGGPAYLNIQPPNDPSYPTPEPAVGNVELVQNSVSAVIIGTTGQGYSTPPLVNVTPAQNNYPAVAAQLVAILNSGTDATATAQILPTYYGTPVQGGSFYLRNGSMQTIYTTLNPSPVFSGNIFLQGTLDNYNWFNIKQLTPNLAGGMTTDTVIGKYVLTRVIVEDFASGSINNISLTYGYNG